ncbi:MAG: HAMP domain-containing histidine kinase [Eubacterium sp.]|nr:HAMP domain-containing histidine kinase [Eubacterium sp.]
MRKKLTQKTFLLLTILSLTVCLLAYGCIWVFLPNAGQRRARRELEQRTQELVKELRLAQAGRSEELFLEFIRETGAQLSLQNDKGQRVSMFTFQEIPAGAQQEAAIRQPFKFADADEEYLLMVSDLPERANEIMRAIWRSLPLVTGIAMLLSFGSAWFFSCYTTRPVLRINHIASKMAELDFSWYCPDVREDEIGMLAKSINELSDKLHEALEKLQQQNTRLEDEIQIEKERERRRMLFFSGISHELKTPLAIVIGQIEGMQAGIGVYKDRDRYLARSAQILHSLNAFIKEILMVSKIDLAGGEKERPVCLSGLVRELLAEYEGYAEFLEVSMDGEVADGLYAYGDERLLKKAAGNIIGNAVTHSPADAAVKVELAAREGEIRLTVTNAPAHIEEEDLPHLFEAFYRADHAGEHGSGLGLYITRLILETYQVPHTIENTADGVRFTAFFQAVADKNSQ